MIVFLGQTNNTDRSLTCKHFLTMSICYSKIFLNCCCLIKSWWKFYFSNHLLYNQSRCPLHFSSHSSKDMNVSQIINTFKTLPSANISRLFLSQIWPSFACYSPLTTFPLFSIHVQIIYVCQN